MARTALHWKATLVVFTLLRVQWIQMHYGHVVPSCAQCARSQKCLLHSPGLNSHIDLIPHFLGIQTLGGSKLEGRRPLKVCFTPASCECKWLPHICQKPCAFNDATIVAVLFLLTVRSSQECKLCLEIPKWGNQVSGASQGMKDELYSPLGCLQDIFQNDCHRAFFFSTWEI